MLRFGKLYEIFSCANHYELKKVRDGGDPASYSNSQLIVNQRGRMFYIVALVLIVFFLASAIEGDIIRK